MARVTRVLRYLLLKALSGKRFVIDIARMYFVENASPRDIASALGLSKHSVRGYINRIESMCGGYNSARKLVKLLVDEVETVPSVVERKDVKRFVCRVCGYIVADPERHLETHHPEVLDREMRRVVEAVRKRVAFARGGG